MEDIVCYCFGYSVQDIEEDIRQHGKSTIIERIVAEKHAEACHCAEKNPKRR